MYGYYTSSDRVLGHMVEVCIWDSQERVWTSWLKVLGVFVDLHRVIEWQRRAHCTATMSPKLKKAEPIVQGSVGSV